MQETEQVLSPNPPDDDSIWTTRFGADPAVVGSRIEMDGARTVVGVMPQGFDYPRGTDFWILSFRS